MISAESDAYIRNQQEEINMIATLNSKVAKNIVDTMETPKQDTSKGMKFDTGKLQYSLIPPEALEALAQVLTFGAQKYAPNNWQKVENGEVRYMDALYRHLEAFRKGEVTDPESGLPHLAHAITNIAFLHYLQTKAK